MSGRLYIIALCGGADRPIGDLRDRTPLEYAGTAHLDALATRGAQALVTVIADDIPPESDSGAMALLGCDPLRYYTGRGVLEGLGIGFLDGTTNGVAFRINFASYDASRGRLDRRTSRDLSEDELAELVGDIRRNVRLRGGDDVAFRITGFGRHRGIVSFTSRSRPLSGNVSNTDPGFDKRGAFGVPRQDFAAVSCPCRPLDESPAAALTAALVQEFVEESRRVLDASEVNRRRRVRGGLPANLLLFRDGSDQVPDVPRFASRFGMTLSMYGQVPAEHGLCRLIGGRWNESRPTAGESDADYYGRLARSLRADGADVVFAHLKGPDEPGHDGRPAEKVAAIEAIDRFFFGEMANALRDGDRLVVTCDHATPCELGIHAADPVPLLAVGWRIAPDGRTRFTERQAAGGALPVRRAADLLPYLVAG